MLLHGCVHGATKRRSTACLARTFRFYVLSRFNGRTTEEISSSPRPLSAGSPGSQTVPQSCGACILTMNGICSAVVCQGTKSGCIWIAFSFQTCLYSESLALRRCTPKKKRRENTGTFRLSLKPEVLPAFRLAGEYHSTAVIFSCQTKNQMKSSGGSRSLNFITAFCSAFSAS